MIDGRGQVRITEFGLARLASPLAGGSTAGLREPVYRHSRRSTIDSLRYPYKLTKEVERRYAGRRTHAPGVRCFATFHPFPRCNAMAESDRDRNLLIGILALQMDFITRDQLIDAMRSCLMRRGKDLASQLLEQRLIDEAKRQFLNGMAEKYLDLHSQDVERSLASLSSISSVQKAMEILEDEDVSQTLERARQLRAHDETIDSKPRGSHAAQKTAGAGRELSDRGSDRFHILRPCARGGLGIVSIAQDTELNREVALKEIQANYTDDEASRSRFLVEAEVTGRLEHPGIVPVYSLGQTHTGTPFYVMRFIRGNSLKEAIASYYSSESKGRSDEERQRQFRDLVKRLVDVCQAIDYAHSRGVLHRDLKPGNIMLGRFGETLVVDWGLAKSIDEDSIIQRSEEEKLVPSSGDGSTETRFGSVVGTVAYMSPEQANGLVDSLGPRSDVYCLGATLYSILTGESPIEKSSTVKMIEDVRSGRFVPAKRRNPSIDPALAAICDKAMALDPNDRYPSAAMLMDDLERWLGDMPVEAYREPLFKRASRFAKRHRVLAASLLAVLVFSIPVLSIFGLVVSSKNRQLRTIQTDLRSLAVSSLNAAESELRSVPGLEQFRNQIMEESFATLNRLHAELPEDKDIREYLAISARLSANQMARTNRSKEGQQLMELALRLQRQILDEAEDQVVQKRRLAQVLRDLSGIQRRNSQLAEARQSIDESLTIIGQLRKLDRDDLNLDQTEGLTQLASVGIHLEFVDFDAALKAAQKSVELLGSVVRRKSKTDADITSWLLARAWEGRITDEMGNYAEARTLFEKAIFQARSILKQKPGSRNFQYCLSRLLHWDARSSVRCADTADPDDLAHHRAEIDEAVEMMARLHADYPESEGFHANYGDALVDQALIHWRQSGVLEPALKISDQSIEVLKQLIEINESLGNQEQLAHGLLTKAEILLAADQTESAMVLVDESLALLVPVSQQLPASLRLKAMVERARNLRESKGDR